MEIPSSNLERTCSAKRRASDKDLPVLWGEDLSSFLSVACRQAWAKEHYYPVYLATNIKQFCCDYTVHIGKFITAGVAKSPYILKMYI